MSIPFFSIVIPAYNTGSYLVRCVESLLGQSFQDFEILLVDDGSTDDTAAIIDDLQAKDSRIRGLHISHAGVSAARNSGLRLAQGEYVLFVDSDDVLVVPDAFNRMYRNLEDKPEMLCYGITARSTAGLEMLKQSNHREAVGKYRTISETADDCIRGNVGFISACTHAYYLPIIRDHQIYFQEGLEFGEDRLFNCNYLKHCKRIFYMKDKLYIYTDDREGSGSHRFVAGMLQILMNLQEKNVSIMLALCSADVSEEEKDRFRERAFFSAIREAWIHFLLYYPSLSKDQQHQGLNDFLALRFPERLCMKGLSKKQRLWLSGMRLAVRLRGSWLLRIFLYAESILSMRSRK